MTTSRNMLTLAATSLTRGRPRHRPHAGRPRLDARGFSHVARGWSGEGHGWDQDQEPDLDSLLSDPLVGLVMNRDGLSPEDVAGFVRHARERLMTAAA
ncbi:hypothetical protein [Roseospira navarrensis]|uniref:Uncharacterized protein n=1 Tax=Roseospira navarrensis TaxID=140058 RepID=A0A7X1ZHI7_9PROT|nr:hypothetical protein [Roseospira navarrensis]MQX38358.1 hypothetical protein [Roseospira navarrensis]